MKNIFNKFDNDNSLDLLLRGNKVTESTHIVSFENSDDALDSLYEIYNESVNKFVEYKSAIYNKYLNGKLGLYVDCCSYSDNLESITKDKSLCIDR